MQQGGKKSRKEVHYLASTVILAGGISMDMKNYVYILLCCDNTLYTGWTNDLESRLSTHNAGNGAKYTKMRLPVKMVYCETCNTKSDAMKREYEIKKLSRKKKLALIEGYI